MRKNNKSVILLCFMICAGLCCSACDSVEEKEVNSDTVFVSQPENNSENESSEMESGGTDIPSKEDVITMRSVVLEGMSDEEIERLTENIKVANLIMEDAYLNDNIFGELSDPDSPYWQYFNKKGDIQLGWWYNGQIVAKDGIMQVEGIDESAFYERGYEPGMVYNRFDAANFIALIEEMQDSVKNEMLRTDLQQLIDLTYMAEVTHEMEYANQVYKILHDMDYFLLRYGIEDVGIYTHDGGTVAKYYGVLSVYGATPYELDESSSYQILYEKSIENDPEKYGEIQAVHKDFQDADGKDTFYYDMECFYFDDTYPAKLNKALQTYYDSVEKEYIQDSKVYKDSSEGSINTPYNSLIFQYFTYVGDDYVSLVFNNVSYMGGAHPYSAMDGITIDCATGKIVKVQEFLDDTDEEIAERLQAVLGLEHPATMEEWDYYLSGTGVVFFYYDPRFWEPVVTRRVR